MRGAFGILLLSAASAFGQPAEPLDRYGLRAEPVLYPQATAKQTVATLAALIERKKFDYLAAHVINPDLVDKKVSRRSTEFVPNIERQLDERRTQQRQRPVGVSPDDKIPDNPKLFNERVQQEADKIAFAEVVKDIGSHLSEYPEHLTLFRKLSKDGTFAETATDCTVTLKGSPEVKLVLRKVSERWVVEDNKAEPEPKK